jgi:transcriptional regulator with XRE-family HTH domain
MKLANPEIRDALAILHRRYYAGRPERLAALEQERANTETARQIFILRQKAGLSQRQLARLVGTTASVICRLEDADYDGHSLAMLRRIAAALNRRVEIRFVPALHGRSHKREKSPPRRESADGPKRRRQKRKPRSRFRLKSLLARVTPQNLESTVDWGSDVGTEIFE